LGSSWPLTAKISKAPPQLSHAKEGKSKMPKPADDEKVLRELALTCLQRSGKDPVKAMHSFLERLHTSPEIRALIGEAYIKEKAHAYLDARAREMRGGTADKPVAVRKHNRGLPGYPRITLDVAQHGAKLAPKAYILRLSDGRDLMAMPGREIRALIPRSAFDGAISFLLQQHARFEDDTLGRDIASVETMKFYAAVARRFSDMVASGVEITIQAFWAIEQRNRIEAKPLEVTI
jgi:hypothetical protein